MPELPEVEVIRQFLDKKIVGQTISKINILTQKSFIGSPNLVEGQKIIGTARIGKQLSLILENNLILLFHLKMTGQIIYSGASPIKSTRLVFHLTSLRLPRHCACPPLEGGTNTEATKQSLLYFNDQRKFGWVRIFTPPELVKFQSNLGPDIFDPKFSPKYLFLQLQHSTAPIKTVLLDQSKFAGIGNIYANDALFLSGIHPSTPSKKISRPNALKLYRSLLSIMHQSVVAGGSTAKDRGYLKPDGSTGSNQFFFRVYQQTGEPCPKCKTTIEYIKVGGRGTFFCPKCQKSNPLPCQGKG